MKNGINESLDKEFFDTIFAFFATRIIDLQLSIIMENIFCIT